MPEAYATLRQGSTRRLFFRVTPSGSGIAALRRRLVNRMKIRGLIRTRAGMEISLRLLAVIV
jgi:hypothetical protein